MAVIFALILKVSSFGQDPLLLGLACKFVTHLHSEEFNYFQPTAKWKQVGISREPGYINLRYHTSTFSFASSWN